SIDNNATNQPANMFSNLDNGSFTVVVTDSLGCQTSQIVTLTDNGNPNISSIISNDPSCGNNNGDISINANGGTGSLSYSINNGSTSQPSSNFTGLADGTYDIVVTDS